MRYQSDIPDCSFLAAQQNNDGALAIAVASDRIIFVLYGCLAFLTTSTKALRWKLGIRKLPMVEWKLRC